MSGRAVLRDGTVVTGREDLVAQAVQIEREQVAKERLWIADLRAAGVKAAHPDDGWVNRERNEVHLCYPQFGGVVLEPGDLMALGWPDRWRLVRVTGFRANRLAVDGDSHRWYVCFEPAEERSSDALEGPWGDGT